MIKVALFLAMLSSSALADNKPRNNGGGASSTGQARDTASLPAPSAMVPLAAAVSLYLIRKKKNNR